MLRLNGEKTDACQKAKSIAFLRGKQAWSNERLSAGRIHKSAHDPRAFSLRSEPRAVFARAKRSGSTQGKGINNTVGSRHLGIRGSKLGTEIREQNTVQISSARQDMRTLGYFTQSCLKRRRKLRDCPRTGSSSKEEDAPERRDTAVRVLTYNAEMPFFVSPCRRRPDPAQAACGFSRRDPPSSRSIGVYIGLEN